MKRRIVVTVAAGAAAVWMLSGFDAPMTVQELSERSMAALSEAGSLTMDLHGDASLNLRMTQAGDSGASMNIPLIGNVSAETQIAMEPFQAQFEANYKGEAMGQGTDGSMEMYILENEDGSADAWLGTYDGAEGLAWEAQSLDAGQLSEVKKAVRSMLAGDTSTLGSLTMNGSSVDPAALAQITQKYQDQLMNMVKLSPDTIMVNGEECYQVTADLSGEDILPIITDLAASSGGIVDDASREILSQVLGGIRIRMESEFDAKTCLPVQAYIDLGGSDLSAAGSLIVSSMMGGTGDVSANIDVSALNMDCSFTFNQPLDVTVPEEALAAGGSSQVYDPDELIGSLLTGGNGTGTGTDGQPIGGGTGTDGTGGTDIGGSDIGGTDIGGSDGTDETEEVLTENPDGSYHAVFADFSGNVKEATILPPDGLAPSYAARNYIAFDNDRMTYSLRYSMYCGETAPETVAKKLDVSFMEGNADYSEVTKTDVIQAALPDGTPVYYGSKAYKYGNYRLGATCCAVQAGDWVIYLEIEPEDEHFNFREATEAEVLAYAGLVKPEA